MPKSNTAPAKFVEDNGRLTGTLKIGESMYLYIDGEPLGKVTLTDIQLGRAQFCIELPKQVLIKHERHMLKGSK
jgi:hypothetical protein